MDTSENRTINAEDLYLLFGIHIGEEQAGPAMQEVYLQGLGQDKQVTIDPNIFKIILAKYADQETINAIFQDLEETTEQKTLKNFSPWSNPPSDEDVAAAEAAIERMKNGLPASPRKTKPNPWGSLDHTPD